MKWVDKLERYFAKMRRIELKSKLEQRRGGLTFRLMGKTANYVTRYILRSCKGYTHGSTKTPT